MSESEQNSDIDERAVTVGAPRGFGDAATEVGVDQEMLRKCPHCHQQFSGEFAHRVELDAELRRLEVQVLRSKLGELEAKFSGADPEADVVVVNRADYVRMQEAEYHLSRLLHRVNDSPLGSLARRRWGFRELIGKYQKPTDGGSEAEAQ